MTALVTGGGGFIGRHLVRRLRAAGTEVRAIARSEASAAQLRAAGCEVVVGDVLDTAALRTALASRTGRPTRGRAVSSATRLATWRRASRQPSADREETDVDGR